MRANILKAIIGIFLYAGVISAYERKCDEVYGRPKYDDCLAAARRIPQTFTPIFIGPVQGQPGTITTPFVIAHGNCEIRIQTSARIRTKWLVVQNIAAILVTGVPTVRSAEFGCVKGLGIGGVATASYVNDPMWVEVKEKGVAGPPAGGDMAPLLKGVGPELRFVPDSAPLPPGWFPPGSSSSTE